MNEAFYYAAKFLPLVAYPLGLSINLCLLALLLLIFKRRRKALLLALLALTILIASSLPVTSWRLVRSLESRYDPKAEYPQSSAIVLLGGAGVPALAPRIYPETGCQADRILHTARLYHQGFAPWVVAAGGWEPILKDFDGSESDVNRNLLAELFGVPREKVLVESESRNTREHPPGVKALLEKKGLPPVIILVTSAMHMERSVKVFEKAGFTVYPAPTDFGADADFQPKAIHYLPHAGALSGTTAALHEYYGMLAYRIFDWF
jgi:uncharacterized SAM-binding protein YcdF (DUF218 family)